MRLIKLDAIESTNDFLKGLAASDTPEDYTVVTAETQTKGRGQMGTQWTSEPGKNLTASVFVINPILNSSEIFKLNIAVSLAVIATLSQHHIPELSVKWPNDIMSAEKKVGGILIENSLKSDGVIASVIGIGLNVNQLDFESLPQASSLAVIMGRQFNREALLTDIVTNLKRYIAESKSNVDLPSQYIALLFKFGVPMPFEQADGSRFMAIISGVSESGLLQLKLASGAISEYDLKQVRMLY